MKSIEKADIRNNTKVLIRADLDVPIEDGKIKDTYRLDKLLPTLSFVKERGGKIILIGHIGRPGGEHKEELSTKHLKPYFDKVLGENNYKLLENLRFDSREKEGSEDYAREIITKTNADIYVNESFATCHRSHTSMVALPKLLPSYVGIRLQEEVDTLSKVLEDPNRPLVLIVGGAKVETKKPVIDKFLEIADDILVGGKIGFDWKGKTPKNLHLPVDYKEEKKDIGNKTLEEFVSIISSAGTVVWAGPIGLFEDPKYAEGTKKVIQAIVDSKATSMVGGGDTVAALKKFGMVEKMGFVSTGGGAMLKFLETKTLPALEVL